MARGEHIKVRRFGGCYSHHGIDMGDGTVIHFCGEPLHMEGARVCRVPMEAFLQGGARLTVPYDDPGVDPERVAAEAEGLVGMEGYDLLRNNCEHFVHFFATGLRRSIQVERALKGAALVATGAFVLGTAALGALVRNKFRGRMSG